jgi:hypothetical protein
VVALRQLLWKSKQGLFLNPFEKPEDFVGLHAYMPGGEGTMRALPMSDP